MDADTLQAAMHAAGLEPPEVIEPGRFIRFGTNGKRHDAAGWVFLFPDERGATFGDWRTGQEHVWHAKQDRPQTQEERERFRRMVEQARRERQTEMERQWREAAQRAQAIWDAASPAPANHAYLTRKQTPPDGLRLCTDGEFRGWLVVPVRGASSALQSLQFIAPDGAKRFLSGGKMKGGRCWLGEPTGTGALVVCEGWATASTLHQATGHPVCCAFNAGNLGDVARMVREQHPAARMLVCGDDDCETEGNPGRTKATEAAEAVGAGVVFPAFTKGTGTDFNDLHKVEGLAVVRSQVAAALGEPEPDGGEWLQLEDWRTFPRFTGEPPPREWLVDGVFPLGKAALLAAAGGIGKSFLLLELAYRVATPGGVIAGVTLGHFAALGLVKASGTAVLLCGEDDSIEVHHRLNGLGGPVDGLIVVALPDAGGVRALFTLDEKGRSPATTMHFHALAEQLRALPDVRLICFDPLQALCGGLDLNLPQHAQHVCGELAKLAAETGAAVIVSHHFRKGGEIESPEQAREAVRGSGGLVDGVRSVVAVWPDGEQSAKATCRTLGQTWERGKVCRSAVVKANFRADLQVQTLVRDECGLLVNRTLELGQMRPDTEQVHAALVAAIAQAATEGEPFTKTGAAGIHAQRHRLPHGFHEMPRARLEGMTDELLSAGRLKQFRRKPSEKHPAWLDVPDGMLSRVNAPISETETVTEASHV